MVVAAVAVVRVEGESGEGVGGEGGGGQGRGGGGSGDEAGGGLRRRSGCRGSKDSDGVDVSLGGRVGRVGHGSWVYTAGTSASAECVAAPLL